MDNYTIYTDNTFGPNQVLPATSFKTSKPDGTIRVYKTKAGPSSEHPISVYSFFKKTAEKYGDATALIIQRNDEWMKWNYTDYFNESCIVAKAMIKLGLERFHGVCIMGSNCPEWMISSIATAFAGGFSAGVYTTNSPEACYSIAENCEAQIIIVEDGVALQKFLAVKHKLPNIKVMVQWSGDLAAPGVISWNELINIGSNENDDSLQRRLSLSAVNQCCTLIYTSGTTGPPKGVMLTQDHMTWGAKQYKSIMNLRDGAEVILSFLPLSHLAAHLGDIYIPISVGATVYFAPPDALKGSLGEWLLKVRPTRFCGVPRIWEKIHEKMQEVGANSNSLKAFLGSCAKLHGQNYYNALREGREQSIVEKWKFSLADEILLKRVRRALGLERALSIVSGSAPIDSEVLNYFFSLNLPIVEGYGLSESLSLCSFSLLEPHQFKVGSVGKVLPMTEVILKHSDEHRKGEGEICIRGRNVCMGYLRMPDKTNEAIDNDGWLHTGDLGWIDSQGFLYITGRLKELVITAGGENIPPVLIEEAVKKELPCISNAMLIGDKRKYLSLLLTLKAEVNVDTGKPLQELTPSCQKWMQEHGSEASTVQEACSEIEKHPIGSLAQAIQKGIDRYNDNLAISNAQKVQKWRVLAHDFSLPTEELNNTLKLKRAFVLQKYARVIDEIYSLNSGELVKSKL